MSTHVWKWDVIQAKIFMREYQVVGVFLAQADFSEKTLIHSSVIWNVFFAQKSQVYEIRSSEHTTMLLL